MPPFGEALGRLSISDFKPREGVIESDRFSMEYRQEYGLQPNRSGTVLIPALRVGFRVDEGDWQEILTDELEVEVEPILTGDSTLVYQPTRARLDPLKEYPDWLLWVAGGILVSFGVGFFFLLNRSTTQPYLRSPYEEACTSLDAMVLTEDTVDQWYAGLSHIIRMYIENTWKISALEQTTEELGTSLPVVFFQYPMVFSDTIQETLWKILRQCDGIKFAGQSVDEGRAIQDQEVVRNLIQELYQRQLRMSEEGTS